MKTRLPVAGEKRKSGLFNSSVSRNGTRGENEGGVDCVYSQISPRDNKRARARLRAHTSRRRVRKTRVIIRLSCESRACLNFHDVERSTLLKVKNSQIRNTDSLMLQTMACSNTHPLVLHFVSYFSSELSVRRKRGTWSRKWQYPG